jgi:prepilin-type N-terminal cleavage/methylation domain-containing protein
MLLSNKNQMKNAFKLSSNLHPLSLPLKGGEATPSINTPLSGEEQKRELFKDHNSKSAFTLVELAIVLVIVGLITVGVVGGQSIIYTANVNSTIAQMRGYNTALNAFKLEFGGIPGDFKEAEEYGIHTDQNGDINTCPREDSGGDLNGNGNGILESRTTVFRYHGEIGNFFPHLQNSGLIKNQITLETKPCNNTDARNAGDDYPLAKIGNSIMVLSDKNNRNLYYVLGGAGSSIGSANLWGNSIIKDTLTAKEASDIDKKVDDGRALLGIVRVITSITSNNRSSIINVDNTDDSTNCVYNSAYNLGYDEQVCTLAIEAGKF